MQGQGQPRSRSHGPSLLPTQAACPSTYSNILQHACTVRSPCSHGHRETACSTYPTACHATRTHVLQYTCTGHSPWSHGHRGRSPGPCLVSTQTACPATCSQRSCSGHTHSTLSIYPLHHHVKRNSVLQSVDFCNLQLNAGVF